MVWIGNGDGSECENENKYIGDISHETDYAYLVLHGKLSVIDEKRRLPKGMQELTMKKILRHFEKNAFARSAEEITKSTGLSLATVQRYLRYLAESDLVKKELTYGSQGRPEHKYSKV